VIRALASTPISCPITAAAISFFFLPNIHVSHYVPTSAVHPSRPCDELLHVIEKVTEKAVVCPEVDSALLNLWNRVLGRWNVTESCVQRLHRISLLGRGLTLLPVESHYLNVLVRFTVVDRPLLQRTFNSVMLRHFCLIWHSQWDILAQSCRD